MVARFERGREIEFPRGRCLHNWACFVSPTSGMHKAAAAYSLLSNHQTVKSCTLTCKGNKPMPAMNIENHYRNGCFDFSVVVLF